MNPAFGGLAEGLNAALQQYLGTSINYGMAEAKARTRKADLMDTEKYKADLEYQRQSQLQKDQMARQQSNAKFEQSLKGTVDPDTADSLASGLGDTVKAFAKTNGRNPTSEEFHQLAMAHPKLSGANNNSVSTGTFLTMLQHQGMDENELASLKSDLEKQGNPNLPLGLIENYMKTTNKGNIPDASLFSAVKDDPTYRTMDTPAKKAKYFEEFKSAFKEPGKTVIAPEDIDTVAKASLAAYQAAMKNPKKYPNPLAAAAKELSKRYTKNSTNQVLLHITAMDEEAKAKQNASAMPTGAAPQLAAAAPVQVPNPTPDGSGMMDGNGE